MQEAISYRQGEKWQREENRQQDKLGAMTMIEQINEVVLPGDFIWKSESDSKERESFKLGPGLRQESGNIIAFKAGVLRKKEPNILWVDSNQRRVMKFFHILI